MPYKFEYCKTHLPKGYDRRVKVSDELKIMLRSLYKEGYSLRQLAKMYDVGRGAVTFAVFPERYEQRLLKNRGKKLWKKYYNKEKHQQYVKSYRRYKKGVMDEVLHRD